MKKTFNTTGACYSDIHYMMDNSKKLSAMMEYIELGKYITINRPRQYGKTTTLYALVEQLNPTEIYLPIQVSFEDVRDVAHTSDDAFAQMFLQKLQKVFKRLKGIGCFLEASDA